MDLKIVKQTFVKINFHIDKFHHIAIESVKCTSIELSVKDSMFVQEENSAQMCSFKKVDSFVS